MFLIPPRRKSPPKDVHHIPQPPPSPPPPAMKKQARARNACSRCRIKKIKCDGRFPCGRCEHDKAICKLHQLGRGVSDMKDISRDYISSLETQRQSLFDVLRQLCEDRPEDEKVKTILHRLEASGFDVSAISRSKSSAGSKSRDLDPTLGSGNQADSTAQIVTNRQASGGESKLDASTLVDTLLLEGALPLNSSYLTEPTSLQHTADATSSLPNFPAHDNGSVMLGSRMGSTQMTGNLDILESLNGALDAMQPAETGDGDFGSLWWFDSDNIAGIHSTHDTNDINHPNNANKADIWDMV